jgi:1A family penicillin-binding protein
MDRSTIPRSLQTNTSNVFTKIKDALTRAATRLRRLRSEIKEKGFIPAMKKFIYELYHSGKRPILYLIGLGILMLILTPIFTYVYFVRDLSSKESIITRKNEGVILLDRNEKAFFTLYEAQTKNVVTIDNISEDVQHAVVAVEDKDFYTHRGFSVEGFGRAIIANIKNESLSQGGSTISQQLVKNTLLTQDKNFLRKYQELFLAIEIDRRYSKEDVLEMYLNTSYFGEGAFGIQDAAKTYFSKDAKDLTLAESALMAGILPAPSAYSPISGDQERAFRRQKIVLQLMQDQGYITEDERVSAEEEEIEFNTTTEAVNITAPHFALMIKDQLIEKYGEQEVAGSGFIVKTTLDSEGQEYAQEVVKNQVDRLARNDVTNGAAVVMDPKNGEILALVGSHDWIDESNGKINMATRARQPGSSFKPIIYAKALEDKSITPATQIEDKEITFPGGYKPRNYDNRFRGKVLIRYALANSLNIPAVLVMDKVGIREGIEYAESLGITSLTDEDRYGLSLVLGAAEVPLTQMTEAYAVFANEGVKVDPTTILSIKDKKGKVIFEHESESNRVIPRSIAFQISSILSDNRARSDTFGGSLSLSRPAAVKTGTTENYRDALTIGYTPQIVVGAWVGNNDNTEMDNIAGSLGAAPIWRQLMDYFLRGKPVVQFRQPDGVVKMEVCGENGLRSETATTSAYPEYFLPGTTPKESCNEPTPTPENNPEPTQPPDQNNNNSQPTNTPAPTFAPLPSTTPIPTGPTLTPSPTDSGGGLPILNP